MKKFFVYIICLLLIYIYAHNPLLALLRGTGSIKLLYLLVPVFFVTNAKLYGSLVSRFSKVLVLLIITYMFLVIRTNLSTYESNYLYTGLVLIIEEFFLALTLITVLLKFKLSFESFVTVLLILASVGSVISTVCLLSPSINSFVRSAVIVIKQGSYLDINLFRGFGISDELTYSYGIIQGFLLSLGLIKLKDNRWFILFIPFVALSILVNARTGFIIAIWGTVLYFLSQKVWKSIGLGMVIVAFVVLLLPTILHMIDSDTANFITNFFDELALVTDKGEVENTTVGTLMGSMVILPEQFDQWIWGRGYYMFGHGIGAETDVGWFLQLNLGGIVYLFLLFLLVYSLIKNLRDVQMERSLVFLLIGTIVISNTKGDFLYNSGGFRLLLLFMFYSIVAYKRQLR